MKRLLIAVVLCVCTLAGPACAEQAHPAADSTQHPARARRAVRLARHPVVALTFDDLPAAGDLPEGETRAHIAATLAAELRAHHLKGVYGFVNSVDVADDEDEQEALRTWVRAGMNIGNHTWSHPSLTDVTAEVFEQDIVRNEPALAQYADGRDWRWFRYPYLCEGDTLHKRRAVRAWLKEHGYRIAQVTLNFDDDDWNDAYMRCEAKNDNDAIGWLRQSYLENAAQFIRVGREEQRIAFGREIPNVLLLHETTFTTLMLPDLLEILHRQGFRYRTLAEVQRDRAYALDPDAASKDGGSLPNQFLNARHLQYPPFTPEPLDKLTSVCR